MLLYFNSIISYIGTKRLSLAIVAVCLLFSLFTFPALAIEPDEDDNCSTVNLTDARNQLGDLTDVLGDAAIDSYTSETVSTAFSLSRVPAGECEDNSGATVACDTYCNSVTSGDITFCYDTSSVAGDTTPCPTASLYTLHPTEDITINGSWFQAITTTDIMCVQVYSTKDTDNMGWITLGCKKDNAYPDTEEEISSSCYVDESCIIDSNHYSKNFFALSSIVVSCIQTTLAHIFVDGGNCPDSQNLFVEFQKSMRKTVAVALSLYIIFFSMKIILKEHVPSKGELFLFALKIILVVYFSIGDGVQEFLYPIFVTSMLEMSEMMYSAGGVSYDELGNVIERGLCLFSGSEYPEGFEYIALFDSLDCRIASYLMISEDGIPMILIILIPAFLIGQILFTMVLGFFCFFTLSILVYVVHIFISSLIVLTLVIYFAPIFVPLALFSYTKKYYDNWIKSLLFGTLQPLVLFAFLAIMLTVFDQMVYGDCVFKRVGSDVVYFTIDTNNSPSSCEDSIGYKLVTLFSDDSFLNFDQGFIGVWKLVADLDDIAIQMMILALFAFLFYHFIHIVVSMAEDLVGGPQNRALISTNPTAIFDKIAGAGK